MAKNGDNIGKKLSKTDVVGKICELLDKDGYDCKKDTAQAIFNSALEALASSLADGYTIELRGFGTFTPKLRKARTNARNPRTGEILESKAHYALSFKAGRDLKNSVAELPTE